MESEKIILTDELVQEAVLDAIRDLYPLSDLAEEAAYCETLANILGYSDFENEKEKFKQEIENKQAIEKAEEERRLQKKIEKQKRKEQNGERGKN